MNISNGLRALLKIFHVRHFTDVHISISGQKYDPGSTDRILLQGSSFVGHEKFQNNAYINGVWFRYLCWPDAHKLVVANLLPSETAAFPHVVLYNFQPRHCGFLLGAHHFEDRYDIKIYSRACPWGFPKEDYRGCCPTLCRAPYGFFGSSIQRLDLHFQQLQPNLFWAQLFYLNFFEISELLCSCLK